MNTTIAATGLVPMIFELSKDSIRTGVGIFMAFPKRSTAPIVRSCFLAIKSNRSFNATVAFLFASSTNFFFSPRLGCKTFVDNNASTLG